MKIAIDLNNVVTSKDQIKPGMHLWKVGQGGVTRVQQPRYIGQVIGFGWADYTFTPGQRAATGFIIRDLSTDAQFVVCAKRDVRLENAFKIPEQGYERNKVYSMSELCYAYDPNEYVSVISNAFLPADYNNWYVCDSAEKAQLVYEEMQTGWSEENEMVRANVAYDCWLWEGAMRFG